MQYWEIAVVGLLILVNGFFAMSELAIVSARRARLQQMVQKGSRGAERAMRLAEDPTGFLSTVQVGITLVGIFNGAYSGATLSAPLAKALAGIPALAAYANGLAIAIVVIVVTYLSLIIGELVPKRIALNNAEGIAAFAATPMLILSRIGAPIVWFLRVSTDAVLTLLRVPRVVEQTVTEEEVKTMIAEGAESGVFHPEERTMLEGVIRIADRTVRSILVPRPDVVWLDIEDEPATIMQEMRESGHSRFPVSRGEVDEVVGVMHAKDAFDQLSRTGKVDFSTAVKEPLFVDEHMPIIRLLERFRNSPVHMAIVLDEHGSFEGIVTPTDILIAIAGDLPQNEGDLEDPDAVQRADGSWLLSGRIAIDEVERLFNETGMNENEDYNTLAGFVLNQLGHIPEAGEAFEWRDWHFEVVDLDGRRIDKVIATNRTAPTPPA